MKYKKIVYIVFIINFVLNVLESIRGILCYFADRDCWAGFYIFAINFPASIVFNEVYKFIVDGLGIYAYLGRLAIRLSVYAIGGTIWWCVIVLSFCWLLLVTWKLFRKITAPLTDRFFPMSANARVKIKAIIISSVILLFLAIITIIFTNMGDEFFDNLIYGDPPVPSQTEVVMPPGSTIEVTKNNRTVLIRAGKGLRRYYTWDGVTCSAVMTTLYGTYLYRPDFDILPFKRKTLGVLNEDQLHFNRIEETVAWLNEQYKPDCTYRDDGLLVCFNTTHKNTILHVSVTQIYVGDNKPTRLKGSNNAAIYASWDKVRTIKRNK